MSNNGKCSLSNKIGLVSGFAINGCNNNFGCNKMHLRTSPLACSLGDSIYPASTTHRSCSGIRKEYNLMQVLLSVLTADTFE